MVKRGKGPKERDLLGPVTVGSGITEYSRPPSIFDDDFRDRARRGALVDGRVQKLPTKSLQQFREEVEEFCRRVFADAGLPDPFSFIHPGRRFTPLDGRDVFAKGEDYLKERADLGYHLAAVWHSPGEDHSPLWYAAQLAIWLTRLDLSSAKLRAESEPPEFLITFAAHAGVQIGRLDQERRLKFDHETDALRGKKTFSAAKTGGKERARVLREKRRVAHIEMAKRIGQGENKTTAASQVVRDLNMNINPKSLVRSFNRRLAPKQ